MQEIHKPRIIIGVYGSLRKGFWNYDRFLKDQEFVGLTKIKGAMQLSSGEYPYLFEPQFKGGEEFKTEHDLEIYFVEQEVFNEIKYMEEQTGFYLKDIDSEFGTISVFYADPLLCRTDREFLKAYTNDNVSIISF